MFILQVLPALSDALGNAAKLQYIGLDASVEEFDVPLRGRLVNDDLDAPQHLLWAHVRFAFEHSKQLLLYSFHYATPPYNFPALLDSRLQAKALGEIRSFWQVILKLESSSDALHKRWTTVLTLRHMTVVREVTLPRSCWGMRLLCSSKGACRGSTYVRPATD